MCFVLSVLVLQLGCKSKPRDPEAEVESTISQLEVLVENKKLRSIKELLHPDYRDPDGRRKADLVAFLQLQFLRRSTIGVLSRIQSLEINTQGSHAEVILLAAAGSRITAGMETLRGISANVFRIEVALVDEDQKWLIQSADWRRARKSDLMELLDDSDEEE